MLPSLILGMSSFTHESAETEERFRENSKIMQRHI